MRTMRKICIALGVYLLVAGCASPEQIAARQAAQGAQIAASDDTTCQSYGLKFGTPEYAQCRQNVVAQRDARNIAAQQANAVAWQQAIQYGNSQTQLMQQMVRPPTPVQATAPNNTLNCASTVNGVYVYTNCF